ncbi:MAG: class I SAM-dependent methyltransferase [Candidatus Zhuqueibacterota bacterium]
MNQEQQFKNHYIRMSRMYVKNYVHRLRKPDSLSILPELNIYKNMRILDVGCRDGKLISTLASFLESSEFHGLDLAQGQIQKNQRRNKLKNLQFHCAPAEELPFENNYFDIITCTNALHHFPQRVRALDQMYRVLKPGGELYILQGVRDKQWKERFEKILRQSKFIMPEKKYLPKTALFSKSFFIHYVK